MKFHNTLLVSAAVLLCTASISASTISHTWVSLNGNDSNPCTATSPCLTFAGALANTTAGGLITAIDAGDFGPVTIAQSVTIDGNNVGSITFTRNDGIYVTSGGNVTVQNLTINGLSTGGDGIYVQNGGNVTVFNCRIINITGDGIVYSGVGNLTVANSWIGYLIGQVDGGVNGIVITGTASPNVVVKNTIIDASPLSTANYGFTIESTGTVQASLQNVTIMSADTGISLYTGIAQITDSVITQGRVGVFAGTGAILSVASSLITDNVLGVCSATGAKIRLDNNDIYDNTTAIEQCGGIIKTSTTNKTSGTISIPVSDVSESVTF